jgi:nucleoside-diphosphate-sugar epimerase
MSRLLITGAGGFVGRACLPLVERAGFEVHAAGRSRLLPGLARHGHAIDLLDTAAVSDLLAEVRPTHLLHLAWLATPGVHRTAPVNRTWTTASLHLVREFVRQGGRRAVLAGTYLEYGPTETPCREEATPLRPASLYAQCKHDLQQGVTALASQTGLSAAWARLFILYGPGEHPARLTASVIRALLKGETALCSPGAQRRDFLHVADAAAALTALLESDLGGAVNVGSGEAVAVRDVVTRLAAAVGGGGGVRLGALPAPDEPPCMVADVSRLRDELRWQPQFDLERGLHDAVAWWRAQDRYKTAA